MSEQGPAPETPESRRLQAFDIAITYWKNKQEDETAAEKADKLRDLRSLVFHGRNITLSGSQEQLLLEAGVSQQDLDELFPETDVIVADPGAGRVSEPNYSGVPQEE